MYIGPWQEFRLAKILRMAQESKVELPTRYFSNSPVRSKTNIPSKDFSFHKAIKRPTEINLHLPAPFYNDESKPGSGLSNSMISDEVQTEASYWRGYRDERGPESRLSYADQSFETSPVKKRRKPKALSMSTPKKSPIALPPLRINSNPQSELCFGNKMIRDNYPLLIGPTLKGKTLRKRPRKLQ